MATFSAQVVDLVGAFSDETALDSFITEGANEIINAMPRSMQERVAKETSFSNTTTSEGSKVLYVLRDDGTIHQPCRKIPASRRGRIQDSSDMEFATATDPAYYIQDALVTIFPTGTGKLVSIPTYNQGSALDASSLSTITNFPNEAEYLVTLYAAIKALQQNMSGKLGDSSITTALALVKNAVDQAETAADKFEDSTESVFNDEDTFLSASSQLTRVKAAVDNAEDVINSNEPSTTTDAYGAQANEDIELVQSALSIANTEIGRAQMHLSEWISIGDMRAKEINAYLAEADGYIKEIQVRLSVLTTEYTWVEKQQAKLQADYDRGIQLLRAG
tara:strand:- start:179 stop:1177 length:999 start_codon:yes stop_codon:yes gene_type:complete